MQRRSVSTSMASIPQLKAETFDEATPSPLETLSLDSTNRHAGAARQRAGVPCRAVHVPHSRAQQADNVHLKLWTAGPVLTKPLTNSRETTRLPVQITAGQRRRSATGCVSLGFVFVFSNVNFGTKLLCWFGFKTELMPNELKKNTQII